MYGIDEDAGADDAADDDHRGVERPERPLERLAHRKAEAITTATETQRHRDDRHRDIETPRNLF